MATWQQPADCICLQVFQKHGGRVQLPIGMAAAEPWLLDSVDVGALLTALSAASGSTAFNVDLLAYCQRGARYVFATRNVIDAPHGQLQLHAACSTGSACSRHGLPGNPCTAAAHPSMLM
jgi:hypothetical protein